MTRDLARLGQLCQVTPSHAKSPKHAKCTNYVILGQKKDATAKSALRHPNSTDLANFRDLAKTAKTSMSHPNDLRAAQFHHNIVDSIHVSSLYARQVMTIVTTFKELQLQHGMQIYLPSLIAHSVILSKFKNSFPW